MRWYVAFGVAWAACYSPQHPSQHGDDDPGRDGSNGSGSNDAGDCIGGHGLVDPVCSFPDSVDIVAGSLSSDGCSRLLLQSDGSTLCVLISAANNLDIGATTFDGPFPILIAAAGSIHIKGDVVVRAGSHDTPALTTGEPCSELATASAPDTGGGGGGGGGGFSGRGGDGAIGGNGDAGGEVGFPQGGFPIAVPTTVRAGCAGGTGGGLGGGAPGGASGGALYVLAGADIIVGANVSANGLPGGGGGAGESSGGGGGGAGGLLGFEAQAVELVPGIALVAKGGGGGGGAGDVGNGSDGDTPTGTDSFAALGGLPGDFNSTTNAPGSRGGAGSHDDVLGGETPMTARWGGGGGGGGAGYILIFAPQLPAGVNVSQAPPYRENPTPGQP